MQNLNNVPQNISTYEPQTWKKIKYYTQIWCAGPKQQRQYTEKRGIETILLPKSFHMDFIQPENYIILFWWLLIFNAVSGHKITHQKVWGTECFMKTAEPFKKALRLLREGIFERVEKIKCTFAREWVSQINRGIRVSIKKRKSDWLTPPCFWRP